MNTVISAPGNVWDLQVTNRHIFITYENGSDNGTVRQYLKGNFQTIVYIGATLTEEEKSQGIVVTNLPQEEIIAGKIAILKVNTSTNTLYYDYIDKLADTNAEIVVLKENQSVTIGYL
ncbi:hypothetical protein [Clostridium sp. CF012]|uniref:hypothetical protein n=1 Tax=Clostridium sp. CF012 TaxID=2843319 RepID=UPI001C0DBCB3|nr:hypothetical protein [Clostridium sp. CF012]MBU3144695.1 hypothetical protein [Clostridium sp. CF012]